MTDSCLAVFFHFNRRGLNKDLWSDKAKMLLKLPPSWSLFSLRGQHCPDVRKKTYD